MAHIKERRGSRGGVTGSLSDLGLLRHGGGRPPGLGLHIWDDCARIDSFLKVSCFKAEGRGGV